MMLVFNCKTRKWQEAEIQELSAEELKALEDAIEAAVQEQMAEEAKRPLTMEEVVRLTISKTINAIDIADDTALRMVEFYPEWASGVAYTAGDRIQYNGKLYKCLQAHTAQADWNPVDAPSLWAEVLAGQDGTAIGEWVQPDSTNPYMRGDKVTHNGKTWVSDVDNNVWAPGVYGWVEI